MARPLGAVVVVRVAVVGRVARAVAVRAADVAVRAAVVARVARAAVGPAAPVGAMAAVAAMAAAAAPRSRSARARTSSRT